MLEVPTLKIRFNQKLSIKGKPMQNKSLGSTAKAREICGRPTLIDTVNGVEMELLDVEQAASYLNLKVSMFQALYSKRILIPVLLDDKPFWAKEVLDWYKSNRQKRMRVGELQLPVPEEAYTPWPKSMNSAKIGPKLDFILEKMYKLERAVNYLSAQMPDNLPEDLE